MILDAVNKHNEILYDVVIPKTFHALYEVKGTQKSEDVDMVLLREPKDAGYYEFSAKDELVVSKDSRVFTPAEIKKSFHADTYCFDSKPELEECNFSGNILKETDDPEKHKRDILTIHMMRREYEVFDTSPKALPLVEFKITYSHLHDGRKLVEIAEEEDKAYQTILNIVSKTRKKLEGKTIAFFRETIQEG